MKRVITALNKKGEYKIPTFCDCIVDYFNKDAQFVLVNCQLENDVLVLTESPDGVKLQHSAECPIKILADEDGAYSIPDEKKKLKIPVAVSVIIESADHHILLTRRPAHMRTSPKLWVPPGGHLELGETLLEGGLREVKEETGLDISNSTTKILCLWESIYPLLLGFGAPTNHVLIVYFHAILNETRHQLQKKIKPDPEEVESFCWLSPKDVYNLFTPNRIKLKQTQFTLVDGKCVESELDPTQMFSKYLWTKGECYSGVQFALKNWVDLHIKKEDDLISKF